MRRTIHWKWRNSEITLGMDEAGKGPSVVLLPALSSISTREEMLPLLDRLGIDECFVYGVFTEYCVKCAIMGLLKTGRKVSLVTRATAHLSEIEGERTIRDFIAAGGQCV